MINQTLAQWFETLEDERQVDCGGTWANAWSPVWEATKMNPDGCVSSQNTQIFTTSKHGDSCDHE